MGPKSERVYRTIREWITAGKFAPGSKLPSERTLSEELEIGRTALRRVLAKLLAEGVVEVHGRSSYRAPDRSVSTEAPIDVEPWQIHGERTLYDNRWVTLSLVDVEPPGVDRFEHHVVKLHHVAIAAVIDDEDRVLMMWRYRFVPQTFGWGLPGGIVDRGRNLFRPPCGKSRKRPGGGRMGWNTSSRTSPWSAWSTRRTRSSSAMGPSSSGNRPTWKRPGTSPGCLSAVPGLMARGELMGSGTLVVLLHVLASRRAGSPPTGAA
ncbi:hypothetical protein P3T26_005205 [Streptomyces sp. MAA16]|nr:hypothetical protein [Streptomyces sp. MAA16]